jgi:hypothetical protein
MAKRKRKPKAETPKPPRDPIVLLLYMVAGLLGFAMLAIVVLVWCEKLPEQSRTTALGGMTGLATAATTAVGIAANRSSIANANAKQTQQIENATNQQTAELKDHTVGVLSTVKNAYDDWAKWNAAKNVVNDQTHPVTFTPDPESEANKRARAEWRQHQPSPPPT